MRALTLQEIKEAFPEGKQISSRLLRRVNADIGAIRDQVIDVYRNENYNEVTKEFIVLLLKTKCLDRAVKEHRRLSRYKAVYSGKEYSDAKLVAAKEYPILELFEPQRLKHSRTRSFCCCPLHEDKTPSLCIYHHNNSFFCFSCRAGGDAVSFVQALNQCSFKEALTYMGNLT